MVFSSIVFLFFFLPIFLLCYFLTPSKFKNVTLLLYSLFFYFFGEREYVLLLLASCALNYFLTRMMNDKNKKILLTIGILINLGCLGYFKYTNFFIDNVENIFKTEISIPNIVLPLGISFFTFQNLSYLIDVYRKQVTCEKNLLNYATYIALFPQLVAGPIVRYKNIDEDLKAKKIDFAKFGSGVRRFIIGLAKKVLIADVLFSSMRAISMSEQTFISYWLVAILTTLQIYYDFSGYSDMAIGLGKMIGFDFKENFDYPLIARSITDFWRRWHMSLSSFFKDYVYIPLGGSRCSALRNIFNIFVVWTLTGLWHGASWNFVIWGVYFAIFLTVEKLLNKKRKKLSKIMNFFTPFIILISFVIFNTTDLRTLSTSLKGMFGVGVKFINHNTLYYLKNMIGIIAISLLGIGPHIKETLKKLQKGKLKNGIDALELIFLMSIFFLSIASILSDSFKPFIYFRF